jgi:hypothetical protein
MKFPYPMSLIIRYLILTAGLFAGSCAFAQQQITSIVTTTTSNAPVNYNNVKGAGLRNASNVMSSKWDSTGSNFIMNYNATSNNIVSITQFDVSGHTSPFITWPVNALVKLRRRGNTYVNDTRNYYNFWARHSTIPVPGSTSGTFNIIAPEVVSPENAFMSNNISSGYDNIFQNTITLLHAGNIERVDYILPAGLDPFVQYDIDNTGVVVFDRGSGDPFKVAAILSVNVNNDPLTYGPLVSVTAAQFGPALLPGNVNYTIMTHDPVFGNVSRPSDTGSQNMRGIYFSLGNLGIAINQRFYGYSIFGQDVVTADPNWNTYPNNTNNVSILDPVNVMSIYKDVNSLLSVPLSFTLNKQNSKPVLKFTIYDAVNNQAVAIERSANGHDFNEIGIQQISNSGQYYYTDEQPLPGIGYYRLRLIEKNGKIGYSDIRTIHLSDGASLNISPNPAKDVITVSLPASWHQKQITATLYDAAGAKLQQTMFTAGSAEKRIILNNIKTGQYFLYMRNHNSQETEVRQVLIIRQ